jgi:hypothetical protein
MNCLYESEFVEISKSRFSAEQIAYLISGYWIIRQGIQPIHNKFEMNTILYIKSSKKIKERQKRRLIGKVNY